MMSSPSEWPPVYGPDNAPLYCEDGNRQLSIQAGGGLEFRISHIAGQQNSAGLWRVWVRAQGRDGEGPSSVRHMIRDWAREYAECRSTLDEVEDCWSDEESFAMMRAIVRSLRAGGLE